jgi:sugar/nucleoside kinase (ribokinase family)
MTNAQPFDLIGVGSPIMDLVARVPEEFLQKITGAKGGMVLVNPEEMSALLALLGQAPDTTTGGSAANCTLNAARLGLRTTFVGKLGNDAFASAYRERFAAVGVDPSRFKHGHQPNATCLALITPDADRTMRTCLAAAMTLSPEEISPADFAGCRHAHIEGYLVFNQALATAVLHAARAAGCTVSLDLGSFEVVQASRDWILGQLADGLDVVFANEDEIRALFPGRSEDYPTLARLLSEHGVTAAVKVGKDGAWLAREGAVQHVAPVVVPQVVDTNGAGDSWAAGFLAGYVRGWDLAACGRAAAELGAETVRHYGPIIPDDHFAPVVERVRRHAPTPTR